METLLKDGDHCGGYGRLKLYCCCCALLLQLTGFVKGKGTWMIQICRSYLLGGPKLSLLTNKYIPKMPIVLDDSDISFVFIGRPEAVLPLLTNKYIPNMPIVLDDSDISFVFIGRPEAVLSLLTNKYIPHMPIVLDDSDI